MIEKGKISKSQLLILVIVFTMGSSILLSPSGFASVAKQNAWLGAIFVTVITPIFLYLYIIIWRRFPDKNLIQINEKVLGRWIGSTVSFLFILYFLSICSLLLRQIGDFMTTVFIPETPIQAIHLIFICVVIMATKLGLETFSRSSEIFFPWIVFLFMIMIVAVSSNIKIENLQPMFEGGAKPIIRSSVLPIGLNLELVVFLMIFPYINQPKKVGKVFLVGFILGGGMIFIITLITILCLGPEMTIRTFYPSFILAKMINIGDFFQRVEAFMAGIWILTIFYKLTILFYGVNLGLAQILKLKDYLFLSYPIGIIVVVLSLVAAPNITYFNWYNREVFPALAITMGFIFPLLLFGIVMFKKGLHIKQ